MDVGSGTFRSRFAADPGCRVLLGELTRRNDAGVLHGRSRPSRQTSGWPQRTLSAAAPDETVDVTTVRPDDPAF